MPAQNLMTWFLELNIKSWLPAIISSLVGGLITGLFMMCQNKKNFRYNLQLNDREDRKIERAVLQALETEIEVIWQRYKEFIRPTIEELLESNNDDNEKFKDFNKFIEDSQYLNNLLYYKISISQDYFTI